jgi:hypothetical protein
VDLPIEIVSDDVLRETRQRVRQVNQRSHMTPVEASDSEVKMMGHDDYEGDVKLTGSLLGTSHL